MFDIINQSSTRIKTALAIVSVLIIVGFINSLFLTWALLGLIMLVALNESMKLFQIENTMIYIYAIVLWLCAYFYPHPHDLIFILGIVFASILAYTKNLNKQLFLPLMYPMVSYLFLLSLYKVYGMSSLLWLLVVVAGADVGAYFTGKSIGKRSFCTTSPNKTIEGVAGGVITASVLGVIFSISNIPFLTAFIISFCVAIASVFGDLFESYLKREADVKDSGDILPGHGGILDRTDGYLFGGIAMFILLQYMM